MLGEPHEISFPQEFFTVKGRLGLNSNKQEGLDPTSGFTGSSVADQFCWSAIAIDRKRNLYYLNHKPRHFTNTS